MTSTAPVTRSFRAGASGVTEFETVYGVDALEDGRWEISVHGKPIARVREDAAGWIVSGIFDRAGDEVAGTLQSALRAATYRY